MVEKTDFKKFGITTKFIFWFLFIALVPLGIAISISYNTSRKVLKEEVTKNLFAIAENKAHQIEAFLRDKKTNITNLSHTADIIYALERYRDVFESAGLDSPEYIKVDQEFRSFLTYHQKSFGYDDLYLISPDGDIIFEVKKREDVRSLYEIALYEDAQLAEVFLTAKTAAGTQISKFEYNPNTGKVKLFIAAPVFKGGEFLGVVIVQMNNQGLYEFVQDYTGLGNTGETVIASKIKQEAVFITPLRFDADAAFKRKIAIGSADGLDIQQAVAGKKGLGIFTDYQGQEVLSVWRYLPTFSLGMVVKMDTAEILTSADQLRESLLKLSLVLLAIVIIVAILIARSVSSPIKELTRVSSRISGGNLLARAQISTKDEIGQLAYSFNKMTDRLVEIKAKVEQKNAELEKQQGLLQRANHELDSFVYTVSHDLRAPLRGVTAFVSFLEEDYRDSLDRGGKDHLLEIRKGVDKMSELIEDLLTLSRISRIQNPYEDVNMNNLINSIIERIKFDIEKHKVDLKIQENMLTVHCDRIKMGEVFLNLITNAIKFSSKNNQENPKVEIGYESRDKSHKFYVKDNGIGIKPEHHQQVFSIFKRLHTDKEYPGTGAGLSIVKRVIDDHGGKIWIESEPGQGTTFLFTIPKGLKKRQKIGEILMEDKLIDGEKLDEALKKQRAQAPESLKDEEAGKEDRS